MRRIISAVVLALLAFSSAALAQSINPIILPGGCGTGYFPLNNGYLTIDQSGQLCISNSGTVITGNATGSTAGIVGSLAAASGKTTYICGFNVQAIGGTSTVGPITIAGLIGSSQVYQTDVNSATVGKTVAQASFNPCIPASAVNTAITVTTTADGTATAVDVNSWGYQQ